MKKRDEILTFQKDNVITRPTDNGKKPCYALSQMATKNIFKRKWNRIFRIFFSLEYQFQLSKNIHLFTLFVAVFPLFSLFMFARWLHRPLFITDLCVYDSSTVARILLSSIFVPVCIRMYGSLVRLNITIFLRSKFIQAKYTVTKTILRVANFFSHLKKQNKRNAKII